MGKRYSKKKLQRLRNDIPVDFVIADLLKQPNKISEGYFRFLCPNCGEFNTAVNPKTNLGRDLIINTAGSPLIRCNRRIFLDK